MLLADSCTIVDSPYHSPHQPLALYATALPLHFAQVYRVCDAARLVTVQSTYVLHPHSLL